MLVYHFDQVTGAHVGMSDADESPLEPGVFLIPSFATELAPPVAPEGQFAAFDGSRWALKDIPPTPEPDPQPVAPEPTRAELLVQAVDGIRIERQPIISILDGMQASALTKDDQSLATAIETSKQALRDLTAIDLSSCDTYEEMRQAVKMRYAQIVYSSPPSVALAFLEAMR